MITKELLSLILGIPQGAITELKPYTENDIVYTTYTLPTIKYKILNLDTLSRKCKEWCLEQGYNTYLMIGTQRHILELFSIEDMDECVYQEWDTTELKAIIKATEWVAKEKGLINEYSTNKKTR